MQIFPSKQQFKKFPAAEALLDVLEANEGRLGLKESVLYHNFPLYRDEEGGIIVADAMLLSPCHGVVGFALTNAGPGASSDELSACIPVVEQLPAHVHSRLIRNKSLRKSSVNLSFDITPFVFAPFLGTVPEDIEFDCDVVTELTTLADYLEAIREEPMDETVFSELVATIDGAKGLIRTKKRDISGKDQKSKGKQAELVEAAITNFDQQQKHGIMGVVTGPQRIRGLAGSGKTVVLAMKAAQTHLQNPDARIAFTFSTKSLYQHVKRLITRFYRQFDDQDPDWDRVQILHGWGGKSSPGLYSLSCEQHEVPSLTVPEAKRQSLGDAFEHACTVLMETARIQPQFDYIFVDEGQDFPLSFIRLCHLLAENGKFVYAYDELQTLFHATTPGQSEVFGVGEDGTPNATFEEDIILHKCYRNPREIIVCAHGLGFGFYSERIDQMLENQKHWEDIGYRVVSGTFEEGEKIVVERPEDNSLTVISDISGLDEIVKGYVATNFQDEVRYVVDNIASDIADGLTPEDILVVSVDDRNAKAYLSSVEMGLMKKKISCNNLHSDSFGIQDFAKDGRVTLATVHKAKGNEAFMVYVVGVDAVMYRPNVNKRNKLFTAMTRAKGWVRVSGEGEGAAQFIKELTTAKAKFPRLEFTYPSEEELKVMKRDLAESADQKLRQKRLLDQLREELSDEEIRRLMNEETPKGKVATKKVGNSTRRKGD
ncbi:hypothetical protein Poly24_27420 [Rosistilla carotiformis]|uniref:DNA 3'-5' helicase II n=1 Tax=Rosistilla carotiformis TaxID=2528017 RepID=A0A518JU10_9BACT|nr:ATP-binding domain-containing protein [Rosistilla carotiformis]QDV69028.1 hypothetical protein Poly24_27420 [Rosistilla carotiformis]